jgi:acetyl-CoA carboxylase biotin carboxyl carrier protein
MEFKDIQELIKMIDASGLTFFELEKENFRILLKKEAEKIYSGEVGEKGVFTEQISGQAAVQPAETRKHQKTIDAPIVGTFYAAASPGGKPFVAPGSKVKKGDTVCIIEAMKLMNEIEADEDLEILEVLAADGEMVEFGQPLFAVK